MTCAIKYSVQSLLFILSIQLCGLSNLISRAQTQTLTNQTSSNSHPVSAVFVFGDSTVDPGNNNYLDTTVLKANFPPYGRDFVDHKATGRFTNGRLVTDFAASYVGLKDYVPPYLDPTLSIEELKTGVSFASAGSGFDPLTPTIGGVISIPKQVEYFREYKKRIETAIGSRRTNVLIKKAVFVASAGTNDFVVNYFGASSVRRQSYTISDYQHFLLQKTQQLIQDLLNEGAKKIVIVGIPPMGCLPIVITVSLQEARKCIDFISSVAREYNQMLEAKLKMMQNKNAKLFYADIYKSFNDIVQNPNKFGFDEGSVGCCGTGYVETSFACNEESEVCFDASKYVFWDSIHPTDAAYNIIFKGLSSTIDLVIKE